MAHRAHDPIRRASGPLTALLALSALLVLVACMPGTAAPDVEREITSATPIGDVFAPRFAFDEADSRIERFDPPGAGAGLALAVASTARNPNSFPIVLQSVDYRLRVAGEVVAEGYRVLDLLLEAGAEASVLWLLEADLAERRALWSPVVAAFAGTPLPIEIEGRVVFSSQSYAFTTGTRPLLAGGVAARESVAAPRLRLDGVATRLALVRRDAPVVSVAMVAQNPGDVGYFLSGRRLTLELNGVAVATLDLAPTPMPARETARVDLVFLIDAPRLEAPALAALEEALAGRRADVRVLGDFAYDVLGVDSFVVALPEPLSITIPAAGLPGAATADDER